MAETAVIGNGEPGIIAQGGKDTNDAVCASGFQWGGPSATQSVESRKVLLKSIIRDSTNKYLPHSFLLWSHVYSMGLRPLQHTGSAELKLCIQLIAVKYFSFRNFNCPRSSSHVESDFHRQAAYSADVNKVGAKRRWHLR
jgi:hypothetical protein